MDNVLKTHQLTKSYKGKVVVDHLDLTVRRGQIYGFLGQNGAGKTTTMRMILGLLTADSGTVELFGQTIGKSSTQLYRKIGSIIENPGFYSNLTAMENLEQHRRLIGWTRKEEIEDFLRSVGIWEVRHQKVKGFSLGMKQRLGLARALMHQPELLILDEPTNGLDPLGIRETRQLFMELCQKREVAILISSHILGEIQQLCNVIGIIDHGRLLEQMDRSALQEKNRAYLQLQVDNDKKAIYLLESELGISDYVVWEQGVIRLYELHHEPEKINRLLVSQNVAVKELRMQTDSLEDYFIRLTGGNGYANLDPQRVS
ncbi:MAG: ABC transporter ATP-binding protein [Gorillibacterium sp.]|nr:ABC transporter ATP-binding protein [Gorillibacterium sp.]